MAETADLSQLPEVVVTATRTVRNVSDVSKAVTIIDVGQIEAANQESVLDLLKTVPGLTVARDGGAGGQITLRGFSSNDNRVALFIDGDRFFGRNTLEYNTIDPFSVSRIEVVRGPAASIYGSDSFGGLVNVITRQAHLDADHSFHWQPGELAGELTSVARGYKLHGEIEGAGDKFGVFASFGMSYGGNYATPLGTVLNSGYRNDEVNVSFTYAPEALQSLKLALKYSNTDRGRAGGYGAAPGPPIIYFSDNPIQEDFAKLSYSGRIPRLNLSDVEASSYIRYLYTSQTNLSYAIPGAPTRSTSITDGPWVLGGKLLAETPWARNKTTFGIDYRLDQRRGSVVGGQTFTVTPAGLSEVSNTPAAQQGPDSSQFNVGIFINNDWSPIQVLTLSASSRLDYFLTKTETHPLIDPALLAAFTASPRSLQTPLTGSVGGVYRPTPWLDVDANASTSFREPQETELFGTSRFGIGYLVPNPSLRPETGVAYDAGMRFHGRGLKLDLTGYSGRFTNLIAIVPVVYLGLPSQQRRNVGRAEVYGWEGVLEWTVSTALNASGAIAYVHATNETTATPLPYVAPINGRLALRWNWSSRGSSDFLEAETRWSAKQTRIDPSQERATAGYGVLDLYAGITAPQLSAKAPAGREPRIVLSLKNVFDTGYSSPSSVQSILYPESTSNPLVEPGRNVGIAFRTFF